MKEKLSPALQRVTLKQLRALGAVTEAGTIAGAARRLCLTAPAVSLQMRILEEAAGMPLLERGEHGLRPTTAGEELLTTIKRIEVALADGNEALRVLSGTDGGRVTVGAVSTAKYFAPRALAAFARAHPNVDVRLRVGNRRDTVAALASYDLDFAVMGRPPEEFAVDQAVIGNHPHVIVGPPDHPLIGRRGLALADLAGETFLLREEGSGTRGLMQRLFARAKITPTLGMEIGSNETIKQAVMAGLGIALISAHTISAEVADGRLAVFDIDGLPMVRKWFNVRRQEKRLLPAAAALWDFLATKGVDFLPQLPKGVEPAERSPRSGATQAARR